MKDGAGRAARADDQAREAGGNAPPEHPATRRRTPIRAADRMIDGALCRQCCWCRKWFHKGWIAYHNCPILRRAGIV